MRIPLELVSQPSGEVLDLSRFERLSVKLLNDAGADATPPTDIQDNHLIVEVTADISQALGTGIYSVEVTGRVADTAFADSYHDYTIRTTLCRVTSDGSDATPTKVTANVIEGLRGLSAYEIAVKHGYTGTEDGWAKSLIGKDGADAYEVAKKAGYAGSREEWLKTLIGATGLSAYELAKAEGYEGSLTEWLASLKGADGDNAYKVAVRNGYQGSESDWLYSLKADGYQGIVQGESIYGLTRADILIVTAQLYKLYGLIKESHWEDRYPSLEAFFGSVSHEMIEAARMFEKDINDNHKVVTGVDVELTAESFASPDFAEVLLGLIELVATQVYHRQKERG